MLSLTALESRSHDVVVRTRLQRSLPRVAGDRVQLQQVLLNLLVNAINAMSVVQDRPRRLTIASAWRGGANAVLVEVRDSGSSLDPAGAEQAFDARVEAHGGRLSASGNEPHGAVFQFSLPAAGEGEP